MPAPVRVAILGFSAFERSAITSYFGLNPGRMPRYELVDDVDEARMVVADADQPGVAVLLRTLGRTAHRQWLTTRRQPAQRGTSDPPRARKGLEARARRAVRRRDTACWGAVPADDSGKGLIKRLYLGGRCRAQILLPSGSRRYAR